MNLNWVDFWKQETIFSEQQWRKNIDFFVQQIDSLMDFQQEDNVLDIGCGPGYLADALSSRVSSYCGVDPSSVYIIQAKKRLQKVKQASFQELDSKNYTNLDFLPKKFFSKVICLSVVQYYQKKEDLESLLLSLKSHLKPHAKVLIADIPQESNIMTDIFGVLKIGYKHNYLKEALLFMVKARLSDYYVYRKELSLLSFTKEDLENILESTKMKGKVLDQQLTLNANRIHLLIQF